jgi:hypothetical protein
MCGMQTELLSTKFLGGQFPSTQYIVIPGRDNAPHQRPMRRHTTTYTTWVRPPHNMSPNATDEGNAGSLPQPPPTKRARTTKTQSVLSGPSEHRPPSLQPISNPLPKVLTNAASPVGTSVLPAKSCRDAGVTTSASASMQEGTKALRCPSGPPQAPASSEASPSADSVQTPAAARPTTTPNPASVSADRPTDWAVA